jgi:sugar/nucleoside kinase (ribokinase family)
MSDPLHFVVAGHLCLDLTPALTGGWPQPGALVEARSLHFSCGGAVGNVGCALWRLGCQVRLVGLVGDDRLGQICAQILRPLGQQPGIRIAPEQTTSYSIVIAPQDCDRAFLHCPGPNTAFTSADVRDDDLYGAAWLHFGYPPLMPAISANGGRELAGLFGRAKARGLCTSLDFCSIGPAAASTDWQTVLRNCARSVTLFAPSIEELRVALKQPPRQPSDISDVRSLAQALFDMGFVMITIKMGTRGMYLATTDVDADLARWQLGPEWRARELMAPCFRAKFVNATGAGDATIAAFIASVVSGCGPEQALTLAAAAGAASVEAPDAAGGVPSMAELQARIASGWRRIEGCAPGSDWIFDSRAGVWNRARQEAIR